jgi:hypothetical protein
MSQLRVNFSVGSAAADLWAFGEDDLADRALELSKDQLFEAWLHAARYYDADFPLPVTGRRVTLGHVVAFAVMTVLEGGLRPLARQRRRPAKNMPPAIAAELETPGPSLDETHRMYGDY